MQVLHDLLSSIPRPSYAVSFTDKSSKTQDVHVDCKPLLQATKYVVPQIKGSKSLLANALAFAEWTEESREIFAECLKQLNIPIKKEILIQIYNILGTNQQFLCENKEFNYPARFNVTFQEDKISQQAQLEIFSAKKAFLLFLNNENTVINKGGSTKIIFKAFVLSKPKIIAYSMTPSPRALIDNAINLKKAIIREEKLLNELANQKHLVKVYEIFYYNAIHVVGEQQIITMKWYHEPTDLFDILINLMDQKLVASDQEKLYYSRQLLEVVVFLHQQKIIHRDIKPENILVSEKGIALTDFGLSTKLPLTNKNERVGSELYVPPEILFSTNSWGLKTSTSFSKEYASKQDVWGVACVLWILWSERTYPWHRDPPSLAIEEEMKIFDKIFLSSDCVKRKESWIYLLWCMLRFNPEDRCTVEEALEIFTKLEKSYKNKESFEIGTDFLKQFDMLYDALKEKPSKVEKDSNVMAETASHHE